MFSVVLRKTETTYPRKASLLIGESKSKRHKKDKARFYKEKVKDGFLMIQQIGMMEEFIWGSKQHQANLKAYYGEIKKQGK